MAGVCVAMRAMRASRFFQMGARMHPSRRKNSGSALVELIIALSITAAIAIYANRALVEQSYEALTVSSAEYLKTVGLAAEQLVLNNFKEYTDGTDVPGVADDLRPTLTEMQNLGWLRTGFPALTPTRQQVRIGIDRANCPGPTCNIRISVCTTTPVRFDGGVDRLDLAARMFESLEGRGGLSAVTSPGTITTPAGTFPNPVGSTAGIVCFVGPGNTGVLSQLVRIRDTRDPNLLGNFTVEGNGTFGGNVTVNGTLQVANNTTLQSNLSVNGQATFGPCINMGGAQGRAGFGCDNPNDLPAGWMGGVRSHDVVADASILVSDAPSIFNGTNTNYALLTVTGGIGGQAEIRTSGRVAANRLTPQGQFAVGDSCDAADEGSIARLSSGSGLVVCSNGVYRLLSLGAAAGDACSPAGATAADGTGRTLICVANANGVGNTFRPFDQVVRAGSVNQNCDMLGATAIDFSTNETLICRFNLGGGVARWMRLQDVTSHLQFVAAYEVAPDATVNKPNCNPAAGSSAQQIIQLIPKVWSSSDGGNAFFAVDNGASWIVRMRNGSGGNLMGSPTAAAIAQIFCYYP